GYTRLNTENETTETVGESVTVAVAGKRAKRPQRSTPGAPQRLDIAGVVAVVGLEREVTAATRQARAALPNATTGLEPEAVHEQERRLHLQRREAGVGLTADGVERPGALGGVQAIERVQDRVEVTARRAVRSIECRADCVLIGRLRTVLEGVG